MALMKLRLRTLKLILGSLSSFFFQQQIILKFLELKTESIFVEDFLIFTKVKPKRIDHLQDQEFFRLNCILENIS